MHSNLILKSVGAAIFTILKVAVFAQISINMPVERSVFQRVNNKANIQLGGILDTPITELQAKLTVLQGGTAIDWTTIKTNLNMGAFRGELENVEAGWYKLELRGLVNGNQVGSISEVTKVGVGEVFIISGQSNAQGGRPPFDEGFLDNTYFGANDDRVNCVNYIEKSINEEYQMPVISKIKAETNIAPNGKASWCWAVLGDQIAQNWNVPVLFFNAAEGSTTANTWSNSANGMNEWPYLCLKKTLDYYGKIFGLRAILWHQGESDLFSFNDTVYQNSVINLINKSREHYGNNISWVIARASRIADYTSIGLKQSQEYVAKLPNFNAFVGPDTDVIQPGAIFRDDNVHFKGNGLVDLGFAWYNSLDENFIKNSKPTAPANNIEVIDNQFSFENNSALGVSLKDFNYLLNKSNIALNWTTENDITYEEFIIEKSTDLIIYKTVAHLKSINAIEKNKYTFMDFSPFHGMSFYRLKLINKNGTFKYSENIMVNFGLQEPDMVLNGNPIKQNNQFLSFSLPNANLNSIRFSDLKGGTIINDIEIGNEGNYIMKFKSTLPVGTYIVYAEDNNNRQFAKKILVIEN